MIAVNRVFAKAGNYILNIGLVNFFEYIIINLVVVLFAYRDEFDKTIQHVRRNLGPISFIDAN